jgi:hypothetical protein
VNTNVTLAELNESALHLPHLLRPVLNIPFLQRKRPRLFLDEN